MFYFILCPFDNWVNFVSKIIELVNEGKLWISHFSYSTGLNLYIL
jgi:hypothetical protein